MSVNNGPKVEFALGNQASPGDFFKSSFARSFVTNCGDAKSLDFDFLDNGTITEESERKLFSDSKNNNFFSLVNRGSRADHARSSGPQSSSWQSFNEVNSRTEDTGEINKLRKQCQSLTEENRRLAETLQTSQVPRVQAMDNVFLQTQIDTLQWQLKQTEANRQMYRSLMGQVVRFLERTRKSLDILHEKSNAKGKKTRVPRSRSVNAVGQETLTNENNNSSSSVICSNDTTSRFIRAKSVAQIAPQISCNGFREFTWSVLRRNDTTHCTPPRAKAPAVLDELNQTHEGVIYRRPKQPAEMDPDIVPPGKLSQEAFRLMRIIQSLVAMREPDLAMISSNEEDMSASLLDDQLSSLQSSSFANSTTLHDAVSYNGGCSSSDRGSTEFGPESMSLDKSSSSIMECSMSSSSTLQSFLPGARSSIDATSLNSNSGSSKTTEEEDTRTNSTASSGSSAVRELFATRKLCPTSSTPTRRVPKKTEKKHESTRWSRSKPANSVSSAEDESGFSSMSSFQEVGLPLPFATPISPIKGCHTEIGLPEVPLDKIHHRRWSSNPVEIQALFKRHSTHFSGNSTTSESLSVWV